jgi:hypothetical protein
MMEPERLQMTLWRREVCWVSKATCAQAHSRARAPSLHPHTHALTHMLALTRARARTHTHTHTHKCVILIAFPLQQWFRERASLLRYAYIACLVCNLIYQKTVQSRELSLTTGELLLIHLLFIFTISIASRVVVTC